MKRLTEALASLDMAVDTLEDSVVSHLATGRKKQPTRALKGDDMSSLFSQEQLSTVKQRLDDAIERLESALETADGAR